MKTAIKSLFGDWMWVRAAFALGCLAAGYGIWAGAFQEVCPEGQDVITFIAVGFAVFGAAQVILSWYAIPHPHIEPHSREPSRLGPDKIPDDAQDDLRRHWEHLREFALHHLLVWNYETKPWLRPLVLRVAPEGCQIKVRYLDAKTGKPVLADSWLLARWDDNPEPVDYARGEPHLPTMLRNRRLDKLFPTERKGHVDAYPYSVSFAIKKQGEAEFYHFNDEAYRYADWRNPKWRMGRGIYKVEMRVSGYGMLRPACAAFRLVNQGTEHSDFLLEPWEPD